MELPGNPFPPGGCRASPSLPWTLTQTSERAVQLRGGKGAWCPDPSCPPSVKGESPVFWSLAVGRTSVAQARGSGCWQGKSQRSQEPPSAPRWAGWTGLSPWGSGGRIVPKPGNWPWSPADLPDALGPGHVSHVGDKRSALATWTCDVSAVSNPNGPFVEERLVFF